MSSFLRLYRYINILSIDIAIGAVVSAMFFARLIAANFLLYGKIALGLTVWIIYTADHLLDARNVERDASSERHRFHQKHFNTLLICLIVATVVNGIVVLYMRKSLLYYGLTLLIVVCLYLVVSRYLKMLKEAFIAFIYTIGVMLPGLSDREHQMDQYDLMLMFMFFLVAISNLLVFSWFDEESDRADGHHSFVTFFGREKTKWIVHGIFISTVLIGFYLVAFWSYDPLAVVIVVSMILILLLILRYTNVFGREDRFRYLGDAVFFLPGVYLMIDRLLV
jgi:4-hydroxybenzoate polyprenyltransferase